MNFFIKSKNLNIPVLCIVVEGGMNAIRMILEHVTNNSPVPVVVCDGSSGAADLISFTHHYARDNRYVDYFPLIQMKRRRTGLKLDKCEDDHPVMFLERFINTFLAEPSSLHLLKS